MFNEFLINKTNLINNVKQAKQNKMICAMVKANAYGVGLEEVVKTISCYVDYFGVACFFEAKKVKKLTNKKILIVGPMQEDKIDLDFSYACSSLEDVENLSKLNLPIKIHIKINSGMNRYGVKSLTEFLKILKVIKSSRLIFEGIFTHFATTDGFVNEQNIKFKRFVRLANKFKFFPIVHADNSVVSQLFNHDYDMVRIGFNLYNLSDNKFKSVVKIKSRVAQINYIKRRELVGYDRRFIAQKEMIVAVVPIGYADGFELKYLGIELFVGGFKCKVLNICMDCFMLDVTNCAIKKGDEIFILDDFNSLSFYSNYSKTSPYEVMTKFSNIRACKKLISATHCENKHD